MECIGLYDTSHDCPTVEEWIQARINEPGITRETKETRWWMCVITSWNTWKERCKTEFDNKRPKPTEVVEQTRKATSSDKLKPHSDRTKTPGICSVEETEPWICYNKL